MTITVDELRAKLSDTPRLVIGELLGVGDGSNKYFAVSQTPIVDGSLVLSLSTGSPVTDNGTGLVEYGTAPSTGVEVKALKYAYTFLSDDTLQGIVDRQSSFALAMVEAIEAILARTDALYSFQIKDKRLDLGQIRKSYEAMLANYRTQAAAAADTATAEAAVIAGGSVHWGYDFDATGRDLTNYAD